MLDKARLNVPANHVAQLRPVQSEEVVDVIQRNIAVEEQPSVDLVKRLVNDIHVG